eukprot:Skav236715  [mRNA]  locus=scaffold2096:89166:101959:- [translate_table: standard]
MDRQARRNAEAFPKSTSAFTMSAFTSVVSCARFTIKGCCNATSAVILEVGLTTSNFFTKSCATPDTLSHLAGFTVYRPFLMSEICLSSFPENGM